MRVLTFSKVFPKKHPRQGEETNFVGKILFGEKAHTIRAGNRWKVGDMFSPRTWSGRPYASKQEKFHPPIEIKKIWDIEIEVGKKYWFFKLNGEDISNGRENFNIDEFTETLAKNDGLNLQDFLNWFPKSFKGQIICWSENINYQ